MTSLEQKPPADAAPGEEAGGAAAADPPCEHRLVPWVYDLTRLGLILTCTPCFWLRIRGQEKVPAEGPTLVVSNHCSHLDPPLLSIVFRRRLAFLAKAELFSSRFFGAYIAALGAFPIKRGGGDRAALRVSVEVLRRGLPLVMFPEGTRSTDGRMGEAKTGVAMLLAQVPECTIVPVRIEGSFEAFGAGAKFPRPHPITMTVGDPFKVSDLPGLPTVKKLLYQEVGRHIMQRISQAKA